MVAATERDANLQGTLSNEGTVRERLEIFVKWFVLFIETELQYYHMLLEGVGTLESPEWSKTVAVATGKCLSSIIPIVRDLKGAEVVVESVCSMIVKNVVKPVQGRVVHDKIAAYSSLFTNGPRDARMKRLVEAGCDIFQSYENQLAIVEADGLEGFLGWKHAMEKLAKDAANKVLQYFEERQQKGEKNKDISLTEGVVNIDSNGKWFELKQQFKSIFDQRCAIKNDIDFGLIVYLNPGEKKVKWNSTSFYEKAGIVHGGEHYKLENGRSRPEKYGYRRLLKNEACNQLEKNYHKDDITQITVPESLADYKYVLKPEDMEAISSELAFKLNYSAKDQEKFKALKIYIAAAIKKNLENDNNLEDKNREILEEIAESVHKLVGDIKADDGIVDKTKQYKFVRNVLADPYILRKELEELRAAATASKLVVVKGLPGMGKRQLVRKYFEECYDRGDNTIWICADSYETIVDSFFEFAENQMGIDTEGKKNINKVVDEVYKMLRENENKSLIVFADQTEYSELKSVNEECIKIFLPNMDLAKSPNVIIIRSYDKGGDYKFVRLDSFTPKESSDLVKKELHIVDESQDKHVQELVQKLAYYPLALKNALSLMGLLNMSVSEYLADINKLKQEFMGYSPESNNNASSRALSTVMELTYRSIKNKCALKFLNIIAYSVPGCIPKAMFTLDTKRVETVIAIEELKRRSLIDEVNQSRLTINPFVQEILRHHLKEQNLEKDALEDTMEVLKNYANNFKSDDIVLLAAYYVSEFFERYPDLENIKMSFINDIKKCYVDRETLIPKDEYGRIRTELYQSVVERKNWSIVRRLIEKDFREYPKNDLCKFLDQADREDRRDIVEYIVKQTAGIRPSDKEYNCTSLLFRSVSKESTNLEVATYLLDKGTQYMDGDPTRLGFIRPSLLHEATFTDNKDLVRLIIQKTVEQSGKEDSDRVNEFMNHKDAKGDTALMWAAEGGRVNAAKVILDECQKRGEDVVKMIVNAVNDRCETALDWTAKEKDGVRPEDKLSVAELLIQYGADVTI